MKINKEGYKIIGITGLICLLLGTGIYHLLRSHDNGTLVWVLVVLMLSIAFLLWKYQKQVLHLVGQFVEKRKYRNGTKTADLSESRRV